MRRPPVAIGLAALLVAGCAGPTTRWVKEDGGAEELRLTQDECARQARRYDFLGPGAGQSDIYRACMENHGWRRSREARPQ
ncbi:MAG TPA: hypothetical protein VJ924_01010 [Alphaproteobacteria bacterium]|nr:hypothetical protein [Alphaproteobacteria bacterium]